MPRPRVRSTILAGLLASLSLAGLGSAAVADDQFWVYVGTYTGGDSKGIYRLSLDPATGQLSGLELAAETPSPSFLAVHPGGQFLYAVNEVDEFGGEKSGSVSAFALDPKTGALKALNSQSSRGSGPCHITVDATGKAALVANYGAGSVAVLPIGADGALAPASTAIQHVGSSVDPGRQAGPHAHSINVDKGNRHAIAADLGLDKLLIYRLDPAKGTLTPGDPPSAAVNPGSGPRHFAFHPDGKHAYVINEMANTVTAFSYDPESGRLDPVQTITTLPEGFNGQSYTAEVQVHPSGKFLYGSNRGHDSLAIFAIDPANGQLRAVGHQPTGGKAPRNFAIDPTGRFVLAENQGSDSIVVFRVDPETGKLTQVGEPVRVPKPVCVKFVKKAS